MKKVMFAASSGGHLTELLKLEELFKEYDYVLVTEKTEVTDKLKDKYKMEFVKYGPCKNKFKYILTIIQNLFLAIRLVLKYKPETVISTGAQVGGFFCYVGKFFGAKVIYIETMAKIKELSGTGNNVYKIADKFYVQWEGLTEKYEKAEYLGRLI